MDDTETLIQDMHTTSVELQALIAQVRAVRLVLEISTAIQEG